MTIQGALSFAIASQGLTALALGYTVPSNPLRLAVAAAVFALTWLFYQTIPDELESRLHVALLSTGMWIQSIKSFDDLCLTGLSFDQETATQTVEGPGTSTPARGPNRTRRTSSIPFCESHSRGFPSRLFFGLGSLWNMRGVGTSVAITQIPIWSSRHGHSFVPSRNQELKRHVKNFALSYLVLDAFSMQPQPDLDNMLSARNERLLSRLADVSAEEAVFRFFATFGFWLNTFCIIQLINSLFGLLYIGLNLHPVEMVPPIWGKLSDAYSVRGFWGNAWHQTVRRPLTSVSEFLVHTVLHIPKGTLLARYCKLIICFYISGALHVPADLSLGIAAQESNAIAFFTTTALVIMCEDGVQYLFHRVARGVHSNWPRYFGYIWVCCYMYWMTPSWAYPAARVVQPEDQLVSFSIIKKLVHLARWG